MWTLRARLFISPKSNAAIAFLKCLSANFMYLTVMMQVLFRCFVLFCFVWSAFVLERQSISELLSPASSNDGQPTVSRRVREWTIRQLRTNVVWGRTHCSVFSTAGYSSERRHATLQSFCFDVMFVVWVSSVEFCVVLQSVYVIVFA
jgi:hypothetical protein